MIKVIRRSNTKKTVEELKALAPKQDQRTAIALGELFLKITENRNFPRENNTYKKREEEIFKLFKELSKLVGLERLRSMVGEERYNDYFFRAFAEDYSK